MAQICAMLSMLVKYTSLLSVYHICGSFKSQSVEISDPRALLHIMKPLRLIQSVKCFKVLAVVIFHEMIAVHNDKYFCCA